MIRKIIQIDESKCNGCGLCANACHEGAIAMVNGVAKLIRDDYCDGLGDCLPACPTGAISFVEREADPYNEAAVKQHLQKKKMEEAFSGCSGMRAMSLHNDVKSSASQEEGIGGNREEEGKAKSHLAQWPVQIKLAPVQAPYFQDADLLIAADCTAFACGSFHRDYMKGRVTLVGCPKLDGVDYSEKLEEILKHNQIKSILVARMEVPCCSGLEAAVKRAVEAAEKDMKKTIPLGVSVLAIRQ